MRPQRIVFILLQLEDESAPSSPFHPFKEFNKRLGIYSPPTTPISPTLSNSHRTTEFQQLEARIIKEYKDKDIMASGDFTIDHVPLSSRMGKKETYKKREISPYTGSQPRRLDRRNQVRSS